MALAATACFSGLGDLHFDFTSRQCQSDSQCPDGQVCVNGWGTSCEAATVCATSADCRPEEECGVRAEPGVDRSRRTCLPKRCNCDSDCPATFKCDGNDDAPSLHELVCRPRRDDCKLDADCAPTTKPGEVVACQTIPHAQHASTCQLVPEHQCVYQQKPCSADSECAPPSTCYGLPGAKICI